MPTYEYQCISCGHRFEASQGINDKPLTKCPRCAKKVKRLISSGVGFIFKGSGFYATDYRKPHKEEGASDKGVTCPAAKEGCNGCKAR